MELNDIQKEAIQKWAAEGCSLSEIQKRLKEELEVSITYMDLRFLLLDLEVALRDKERVDVNLDISKAVPVADENSAPGSVSVTIDRVKKVGALLSGTVTFSDGVTAAWSLDQMGRLALEAGHPDYRPSDSDIQEFQMELQSMMQRGQF
ncbi:MAG: hypothetical protein GX811_10525 [Lentisphaerae bacterium]|jgi:hypothetical protein|nr:hypothetical protein [Lentisphaerota bacterium]